MEGLNGCLDVVPFVSARIMFQINNDPQLQKSARGPWWVHVLPDLVKCLFVGALLEDSGNERPHVIFWSFKHGHSLASLPQRHRYIDMKDPQ